MKSLNNVKGSAILCTAALIWGLAFVAQSDAADVVPPFIFNALRSFIGAGFLFLLLLGRRLITKKPMLPTTRKGRRETLIGGISCGVLLAISINLQQFGLADYPSDIAGAARAGFLTALYVILVPILSIFSGKRLRLPIVLAVLIAMGGIYLLSFSGGAAGIYAGDVMMLLCAVSFSFHILAVDRFVEPVGGILLSMLQFFVCGIISLLLAVSLESITLTAIWQAAPQILYLGIMSSGIAYTLQIVGQRYAEPAVASLSMSLESVFAALGGWLIAGNTLSLKEICGCSLVFLAIVLAQLPQFMVNQKRKKAKKVS